MTSIFDVRSGAVAIGDPVMGLVRANLGLPPGAYKLGRGALAETKPVRVVHSKRLSLDGPYVFVIDAPGAPRLRAWFHRVGKECSYNMAIVHQRLKEFNDDVGYRVGFYWESDVAGSAREGAYYLDPAKVLNAR